MEKNDTIVTPVTGFEELFETGVIVDGTGADLQEIDTIMQKYFEGQKTMPK